MESVLRIFGQNVGQTCFGVHGAGSFTKEYEDKNLLPTGTPTISGRFLRPVVGRDVYDGPSSRAVMKNLVVTLFRCSR